MLMPDDLRADLEKYAKENDRQLSDTIRVACRDFLERELSQANNDRDGGTERKDSAKDSAVPPTGNSKSVA